MLFRINAPPQAVTVSKLTALLVKEAAMMKARLLMLALSV